MSLSQSIRFASVQAASSEAHGEESQLADAPTASIGDVENLGCGTAQQCRGFSSHFY